MRHEQTSGMTALVYLDRARREALSETDRLFHGLGHFLMVQGVGRAVDQPTAIGDSDAAPGIEELSEPRRPALARGRLTLRSDRCRMRQKFIGNAGLFGVPCTTHCRFTAFRDQYAIARGKFLDLADIV